MATVKKLVAAAHRRGDTLARRPGVVVAICCLALFLVAMDVTIVNVALPAIGRDLNTSMAGLQWAVDGYAVAFGCLLMLAGTVADRFGRRLTFQLGLALFGIGSLLCSLASSVSVLVVCRVIQALGGAALNPAAISIIAHTYSDPKKRAHAIGMFGMMTGLSMAAGPVIGGVLTQNLGWRAIFAVNVPVVLAAIALTASFIGESRAEETRRFDPVGQTLLVVVMGALVGVLIEGPALGLRSLAVVGGIVAGLGGFVAFILWERRRLEPLIELRFFRSVPFSAANAIAVLVYATFGAFLFFNAFYLQNIRGLGAAVAGPCLLPMALAIIIGSPLAGRLAGAGRSRLALVISGASVALGAALLMALRVDSSYFFLFIVYALIGAGLGFANAPITNTAVSGMPRNLAGIAAGLASTSRVIGASIGFALGGSFSENSIVSGGAGVLQAAQPLWRMLLGCGLAIVLLGAVSRRPDA